MVKKLILIGIVVLGMAGAAWAYGRTHRTATVRSYYRLVRKWSERPQWRGRTAMLVDVEPLLLKMGVLGPARVPIEPGISYFLDPRDLVPASILKSGEWQPEVWNSLASSLGEGSVFYDVGAHIGYFSMKAALRVGHSGRVVAFEPNPEILTLLRDNVSANRFENVTVEPIACTEREQTLTLFAAPAVNTGASSLSRANASILQNYAPKGFSVRGRPIDDVTEELKLTRVDAIKIDVEGAEGLVLRGAINTLKRFHPKVVLEVVAAQLASFNTTPDDLNALLRSAGYKYSRPLNPGQTDWEWTAQAFPSMVRMGNPAADRQLIRGFYAIEAGAWRWTAGAFNVMLGTPEEASKNGASVVFNFTIPQVAFEKMKGVALSASIGGVSLGSEVFTTPGEHTYRRPVPRSAFGAESVEVAFVLDKSLSAAEVGRELGVVATSVGFEVK